jgi:hypothetical protein
MAPFGWIETRYGPMFPPLMPNTMGVWAEAVEPQAASEAVIAASTTTLRTRRGYRSHAEADSLESACRRSV